MNILNNNNFTSKEEKPLTKKSMKTENNSEFTSGGIKLAYLYSYIFVIGLGAF